MLRAINRLRATMLECFPALEAALDYSKKALLILVAGYQTPDGIRRVGASRLAGWLRKCGARGAEAVAAKVVEAARAQHIVLATQTMGARLVARLAEQIMAIDADIAQLDEEIRERFEEHPDAPILLSMPGFGRGAGRDVPGQHRRRPGRVRDRRPARQRRRPGPSAPGTPAASAAIITGRGATTGA